MKIPAAEWNNMVDYFFRHRLIHLLAQAGPDQWAHPWFTTCAWNPEALRWEATIKPGLVNGRPPTVRVEVEDEVQDVPLTGDLNLNLQPQLPLTSFRSLGTGVVSIGGTAEPVPEFFKARGVADAVAISEDDLDLGITERVEGLVEEQEQKRQLRACDIVLHHQRLKTTVDWAFGTGVDGVNAQFIVGIGGSMGSGAYLRNTARFAPVAAPTLDGRLDGSFEDDGIDSALMATVYLLSPPGAGPEAEIDETWQPFVKHALFWNAQYLVTAPQLTAPRQNLQLELGGLGATAGAQLTVNQLLATNNDAANNALQFLSARLIEGRFTTPGHRLPPDWDKAASLDPPFPFSGHPISVDFLARI